MYTRTSPPRTLTLARFNLVEVILAMVILLIGVVSIMALFPVSQKAKGEAISRTSAGDAADQFMQYVSSRLKTRWGITNALPIEKPGTSEAGVNWEATDTNNVFAGIQGIVLYYNDIGGKTRQFDYALGSDVASLDDSGLFMVEQRTGGQVADFQAILRAWKSPATYSSYDKASGAWSVYKPVPPDKGIVLNVEVSWPASQPYAKRDKATYKMNVFRPGTANLGPVKGAFRIADAGNLVVTYHGSDSTFVSGLHLIDPSGNDTVLFPSQKETDQTTTVTGPSGSFSGGDTFNVYINTDSNGAYGNKTYNHYAYAPEPPDCDCKCRNLGGDLNLNPSNSPWEFTCNTLDGQTITRDTLAGYATIPADGVVYRGKITYMRVKPKGNGNQNTLTMDGSVYLLRNSDIYEFTSDGFDAKIYNDKVAGNGAPMGHWWVGMGGQVCSTLHVDGVDHDERCPLHPNNIDKYVDSSMPYYDNPAKGKYDGAADVTSGNPYAQITEVDPGSKWLIRFEDTPGAGADWDYNDAVVTVELQKVDGVLTSVQNVPIDGSVVVNPNTGNNGYQVSVMLTDGTVLSKNSLTNMHNLPIAAIWFKPNAPGTQTIKVNGSDTTFNNTDTICIAGTDLTASLVEAGGQWKATLSATDGFYTVFK